MSSTLTEQKYLEIFQSLQEVSGVSIFLLDKTFQVTWSNTDHHCFLKRIRKEEGTYCYRVIRKQDGLCQNQCPMDQKQDLVLGHYQETAEDLERIYRVSVLPRYNSDGEKIGFLVIQIDDTQHCIEVNHRNQEASRKFFTHFAGDVAHEINNPLTILYGLLQDYNRRPALKEEQQSDFQTMLKACNRIREFIDYLLRFSTDDSADDFVQDIRSVVINVAGFFQEYFRVKELCLDLNISGQVCLLNLRISVFEQILFNLIHYMADSIVPGGVVSIMVDYPETSGYVHLTFSSTDYVVTPEHLENIFLNFGKNDEMDAIHSLGMNSVHNLLKTHNGNFRIERISENEMSIHLEIPTLQLGE